MKVTFFHFNPYRDLPADFADKYRSVWYDLPWSELASGDVAGQHLSWTLDELEHAARAGFDGIGINEHHQNAYGGMCSPTVLGGNLAQRTSDLDVALVLCGATLPSISPPVRIAEDYAVIDCMSGGRLVAGLPLGTPMDVSLCNGIPPIEQRERYYEALELVRRAWKQNEPMFPWNGKYYQLPGVNLWPRPIQQPMPIWIPGSGSPSTWEFAADNELCYAMLSYLGADLAQDAFDGYWNYVRSIGLDTNPHRAAFVQMVVVSDSFEQAEKDYLEHIKYFFDKSLHIPPRMWTLPGHQSYTSLAGNKGASKQGATNAEIRANLSTWTLEDFTSRGIVVGGDPDTVRDALISVTRRLHVGNLIVVGQIGSMPHDVTLRNIDLLAHEVLPGLRDAWDDDWDNHWWPQRLRASDAAASSAPEIVG
jgi:alkanesulfonate monooxygenase SsuD/methylene tetrahydromethanopterin reductase-like flavin-dependent oxidoreductase (luciferase family)